MRSPGVTARSSPSGFAVATHAIGTDALDLTLTAYEAAGGALARSGQPRIEPVLASARRSFVASSTRVISPARAYAPPS
jgi:hypothetical protein